MTKSIKQIQNLLIVKGDYEIDNIEALQNGIQAMTEQIANSELDNHVVNIDVKDLGAMYFINAIITPDYTTVLNNIDTHLMELQD